jgi:hypothetical protein
MATSPSVTNPMASLRADEFAAGGDRPSLVRRDSMDVFIAEIDRLVRKLGPRMAGQDKELETVGRETWLPTRGLTRV